MFLSLPSLSWEEARAAGSAEGNAYGDGGRRVRLDIHCAICMEQFEETATLSLLPCGHAFHCDCAEGWIADNDCCPMCKQTITS